MKHAKHSRCQEVTLVDGSSYDTAWWVDAMTRPGGWML